MFKDCFVESFNSLPVTIREIVDPIKESAPAALKTLHELGLEYVYEDFVKRGILTAEEVAAAAEASSGTEGGTV